MSKIIVSTARTMPNAVMITVGSGAIGAWASEAPTGAKMSASANTSMRMNAMGLSFSIRGSGSRRRRRSASPRRTR